MKVLLVIDMQNDFIDGALGTEEAKGIVDGVSSLVDEFKKNGDPVIFTRDTHNKNYLKTKEGIKLPVEHCIKGTHGWEISDRIDTEGCKIVNKKTFGHKMIHKVVVEELKNALNRKGIPNTLGLKHMDEILMVGLCTDICVISNAMILKSAFPENEITVIEELCAGVTEESHHNALKAMEMCQINIK